jgi:hypothetical protein
MGSKAEWRRRRRHDSISRQAVRQAGRRVERVSFETVGEFALKILLVRRGGVCASSLEFKKQKNGNSNKARI